MGFFDAFTRAVGMSRRGAGAEQARLAELWGLYEPAKPADIANASAGGNEHDFDHLQWRKKLKRVLEKLPATAGEWQPMLTEARSLEFSDEWVARVQIEEFALLMRRAVADCEFTEAEHHTIELARKLIDVPEDEAEAMLKTIIAEAEAFFGHHVQGA